MIRSLDSSNIRIVMTEIQNMMSCQCENGLAKEGERETKRESDGKRENVCFVLMW